MRSFLRPFRNLPPLFAILSLAAPLGAGAAAAPPDRDGMQTRLAACATCHGAHGEGDDLERGGVYPRLAGQIENYLYEQLLNFRSAKRTGIPPVKIMHRLLQSLPDGYLRRIAAYFHTASPPYPRSSEYSDGQLQAGRELVRKGVPQAGIQPCTSCHGADLGGRAPNTPKLAGQYARYLTIQFEHFAQGARHNAVHEHIATSLSLSQIKAMSQYLASLTPSANAGSAVRPSQ